MYEHISLDVSESNRGSNPSNRVSDSDYDSEEPQSYHDPDFEEEWDKLEVPDEDTEENPLSYEEDNIDIISEEWEEV